MNDKPGEISEDFVDLEDESGEVVEAEFEDQVFELGEEWTKAELVRIVIDMMKYAPDTWQKMTESDQANYIQRIDQRVEAVVVALLDRIAGNEIPLIKGKLEKVVFKGGIEAVIKIPSFAECRHELADAEGSVISLIVIDSKQYTEGEQVAEAEKDQGDLPLATVGDNEQEETKPGD